MTKRALIICSANACRSPSAAAMLSRALAGCTDVDGDEWVVRSAGTLQGRAAIDPGTLSAAAAIGIDLSSHEPRSLDGPTLATDGADLILVATRAHLRTVVGIERAAWPRTFTLKEFARRAAGVAPATSTEGFSGWLSRVAAGRRAADMMTAEPDDDLADPYGLALRHHVTMLDELAELVEQIVRAGPWLAGRPLTGEPLAYDRP